MLLTTPGFGKTWPKACPSYKKILGREPSEVPLTQQRDAYVELEGGKKVRSKKQIFELGWAAVGEPKMSTVVFCSQSLLESKKRSSNSSYNIWLPVSKKARRAFNSTFSAESSFQRYLRKTVQRTNILLSALSQPFQVCVCVSSS